MEPSWGEIVLLIAVILIMSAFFWQGANEGFENPLISQKEVQAQDRPMIRGPRSYTSRYLAHNYIPVIVELSNYYQQLKGPDRPVLRNSQELVQWINQQMTQTGEMQWTIIDPQRPPVLHMVEERPIADGTQIKLEPDSYYNHKKWMIHYQERDQPFAIMWIPDAQGNVESFELDEEWDNPEPLYGLVRNRQLYQTSIDEEVPLVRSEAETDQMVAEYQKKRQSKKVCTKRPAHGHHRFTSLDCVVMNGKWVERSQAGKGDDAEVFRTD